MPGLNDGNIAFVPMLQVVVEDAAEVLARYEFRRTFRLGRGTEGDICINNKYVSRIHIEAAFENGLWKVRDLNSSNGMFVDGVRVASVPVPHAATIRLGVGGPFVTFTTIQEPAPAPAVPNDVDRYFRKPNEDEVFGEHTRMVRIAFSEVQKKQTSKWLFVVACLALLVLAIAGLAWREHQKATHQKELAESLFYSMKSLDVQIAEFEKVIMGTDNPGLTGQIRAYQDKRQAMERQYSQYLTTLKMDDTKLSPRQRLTLRVARIFGECELAMPADFQAEIDRYIAMWKSSKRLENDIATANRNGYTRTIANELLAANLPTQFFYLALQESNFDPYASGPPTRKGIAKGMWQFIPETAVKYGMKVGPLFETARADPGDDRHHWDIETKAAVHYMKDLYTSDAQASGLLVMACYNWGENQVLPLVQSLPANPQERNFWKLLAKHRDKVPDQTYDYVLSIISAAIIGEDPAMFGFHFENPLAHIE